MYPSKLVLLSLALLGANALPTGSYSRVGSFKRSGLTDIAYPEADAVVRNAWSAEDVAEREADAVVRNAWSAEDVAVAA